MSLDKAIEHKKEWRKQYHGSKAIDKSCRNHGSCPWCRENRLHKFRIKKPYEREEEDKTCSDCEYAYFGLDGKDYCEWHGEIDLDDSACSWFHALPDIEEE